jgi:hypothetical protein
MRPAGASLLAGMAALCVSFPVQAQSYRFDAGPNVGGSIWTSMLSSDETGAGSVKFTPGWLVGGQATLWAWPRVGLRANAAYSKRDLDVSEGSLVGPANNADALTGINLLSVTGDVLLRLRQPEEYYRRGEWLPYVALGAGLRWVRPEYSNSYLAVDQTNLKYWTGVPYSVSGGNNRQFFQSRLSHIMFLAGIGSDVRVGRNVALRLEVGDRFSTPEIYEVQPTGVVSRLNAIRGDENQGSLAHELYGQLGLHLTLGGAGAAPVVVVTPPPPPPPPPQPPPPPPPAPREESVTVCVIDPAAVGGIRTVNAVRIVESGDTLVVRGADRVSLRSTLPTVTLVGNADWYVAGRPLGVTLPRREAAFLATGRGMAMSAGQLILLGQVQGIPVYAERSAVASVATRLEQLNQGGPTNLVNALRDDAALRTAFEGVRTLYVPAQVSGCVFQPLQLQEEVRKSGD